MSYRPPACRDCGSPIKYNPKAQSIWERTGKTGPVPGAGWSHHAWSPKTDAEGREIPGTGKASMSKNDPDFHYAVPHADVTPEGETMARQAHMDQMKAHMKRTLSRQFDFLAAEKRGGTHLDLSED